MARQKKEYLPHHYGGRGTMYFDLGGSLTDT